MESINLEELETEYAKQCLMDIGLTEDEADMAIEDYYFI